MTKNNTIHIVSDSVLTEILRKKELIETIPKYHLANSNNGKTALQKEASRHSVSIELEAYDTKSRRGRKEKAREHIRCSKNLADALHWGLTNYQEPLSEEFIAEIGRRVDPSTNQGYRTERVRILGAISSPPSPEKFPSEIGSFLFQNSLLDNIIDQALHAHLHTARIHPFIDGNGRASRLIQNIMLTYGGFPPVDIKPSERIEYLQLINRAIESYKNTLRELTEKEPRYKGLLEKRHDTKTALNLLKNTLTPEQREFYNFLALKIRDNLQREIGRLYDKRK